MLALSAEIKNIDKQLEEMRPSPEKRDYRNMAFRLDHARLVGPELVFRSIRVTARSFKVALRLQVAVSSSQ
jgi:hypothetical protein